MKQAAYILTSDWHLRETMPVCRIDSFLDETQWKKVDFIADLQRTHQCPVLHAGDLFDYWKPSPELLSKVSQHIPNRFYSVYGNHDLPQHNIGLAEKSGLYNLVINDKIIILNSETHIEGCSWNEAPVKLLESDILVWHVPVYKGVAPYPGCPDITAKRLLRKYPDYKLILTGDNHTPFTEVYQDRLLINPGSIFRMTAAQAEHEPRVYLYFADTNTVEPVYLPIEKDVISREHLEASAERDSRIDAFISQLNDDWAVDVSFEANLERFAKANNISQAVMEIIYKAIGK